MRNENAWKKKKRDDSYVNVDVGNLPNSLHKDVNAAALVLEPECAPFALLYCKAAFCSKKIIYMSNSQMLRKTQLELTRSHILK